MATQLMVLGTEGGLPAEYGLLGGTGRGDYLSHGLLFIFLRYGTSDQAKREGRTVCVCGYLKGLRDFN